MMHENGKGIWVIVEQTQGAIRPVSHEVLHAAKSLVVQNGWKVVAFYLGDTPPKDANILIKHGADRVQVLKSPALAQYTCAGYLSALVPHIKANPPKAVLLPATNHGKELASSLSAAIAGGLATDCIFLEWDPNQRLRVRRPVYGGRAISTLLFKEGVIPVVTLRPNIFRAGGTEANQGTVEVQDVEIGALATKVRDIVKEVGTSLDITEARILVSGGLGMQNSENFKLLEELAGVLGGTVGASRPVVDNGWRKYSNQVGQTGRTVSPDLYLACGISGAVQHLAGMSSSKCIVAINKDPNAPIFSVADYGIVGDVLQAVPLLTQAFRKALS